MFLSLNSIKIVAFVLFVSMLSGCAGSHIGASELNDPRYRISGNGRSTGEMMALFIYDKNQALSPDRVLEMAELYIDEAAAEGINHDVAFVQMCLETGFLRYGGSVYEKQFNFAGLGAIGGGVSGERFASARVGVRAHIQHLKAYASDQSLKQPLVDSRFSMVRRGCCPTIFHLSGSWAADKRYGQKLQSLIRELHSFGG